MTKKQIEMCRKVAGHYVYNSGKEPDMDSYEIEDAVEYGFQAAQSPEILKLNPLVERLIQTLKVLAPHQGNGKNTPFFLYKALEPFEGE